MAENLSSNGSDDASSDVEAAEAAVLACRAQLARSLREAQYTGTQVARRLSSELKPVLIGLAVVGLLAGASALVWLRRSRRPRLGWEPPRKPSWIGILARRTAGVLIRAGMRRLLLRAIERAHADFQAREADVEASQPG